MVESLGDPKGDPLLIHCPPGVPVFVLLLLPRVVFAAFGSFSCL